MGSCLDTDIGPELLLAYLKGRLQGRKRIFEAQLEEHPDAKSLSGSSYFYHVKSS